MICVLLPIRIISEANMRSHWRMKARRVRFHRSTAYVMMRKVMPASGAFGAFPVTITLTRIAPRVLDDDNLQSGFKAARDGVADWLGLDDGDKRITWLYGQRKGKPGEYAAEVRVEWEMR